MLSPQIHMLSHFEMAVKEWVSVKFFLRQESSREGIVYVCMYGGRCFVCVVCVWCFQEVILIEMCLFGS